MMMPSALVPLATKIRASVDLSDEETDAIAGLPFQIKSLGPDQVIVKQGTTPTQVCVILEGIALRYKLVGDAGNRQILGFFIPGDLPDLMSLHLSSIDNGLDALSPSRIALIEHRTVNALVERFPRIGSALWRETLIDASITREWLASIGRRDAYVRIAHLICELYLRLEAVGLSDRQTVRLPLTQEVLGDALGISAVHVNRVMQRLRADGLIVWTQGVLRIIDRPRLLAAGEFDGSYIHLDSRK